MKPLTKLQEIEKDKVLDEIHKQIDRIEKKYKVTIRLNIESIKKDRKN